ncbi:hypothetical protein CDLVIII_4030 [Clostridium sp. DL-VIII]|uniref:hypothetical protein n=1 Tax=Clostridium sp. DL-VIII TaxID=641107 RepID=UPI00023AF8EF|nr:hypothetical protein [Clostridium sp. DL-VIII]EHJ00568.1 hypothetical protein CDLVIII_4030 [Clostridium sp. DL-VIII]
MNITTKKSKSKDQVKDDFSINEDEELDVSEFCDGEAKIEGELLRSFSFDSSDEPIEVFTNSSSASASSITPAKVISTNDNSYNNAAHKDDILDHRTQKSNPNGRTPSVDGEAFDMVRSYTLRRSTVRILSKIKVIHNDDNVYLNTIVDEAIRYYYEYLKNNLKE